MSNLSDNEQIRQSFIDERDHLEELNYLYHDFEEKIRCALKEYKSRKKYLSAGNYRYITEHLSLLERKLGKERNNIGKLKQKSIKSGETLSFLFYLSSFYRETKDKLRIYIALISSLATATDWQSPSYAHSQFSQAGRQTGLISANINDYKRDVHTDEAFYENKFRDEYIDGRFLFTTRALLVNSGMAAFSTVLNYLQAEGKITGRILIGKNVYFQNKQLIVNIFPDRIMEVAETDTENILASIGNNQPSLIYLDSLSNTEDILLPDLNKIIHLLNKSKKETYLLLDNTCLATFCQNNKLVKRPGKLKLITIESLNKYHQFGLDRVTAGIMVAGGKDAVKLFEYRKHCGTNISDSSVFALPAPDRKLLEKRLLRHHRNALFLSRYLQNHLQNDSRIEKIIYPALNNHPFYPMSINYPFCGSYFTIKFRKKMNLWEAQKTLKKFLLLSRKEKINLVAGTSFGFDVTRVYLTAANTRFARSFIRISAGTENLWQVQKIGKLILQVLS